MSTASELLAAILANPQEDTPRLVFADYLEENDQPERAEFIRVQIERAGLPFWELRAKQLWHRERVLLARHGQRWLNELDRIEGVEWGWFERGFVKAVHVDTLKTLHENSSRIRTAAPIDEVLFTKETFQGARSGPHLDWIRGLAVRGYPQIQAENLERLLNSNLTANLVKLDLEAQGIENPGAQIIARATHLTHLRELNLSECYVGVAGAAALARAQHLAGVEALNLCCRGSGYVDDPFVTNETIEQLAASDCPLKSLKTINLTGSRITDQGVQRLLSAPALASIENVSIRAYDCTAAAFEAPPSKTRLRILKVIFFEGHDSPNFDLPQLSTLEVLAVGGRLGPPEIRRLASAPFAENLSILSLSDNGFGNDAVAELTSEDWPRLHTLDLARNTIDGDGAAVLARSGRFPALTDLNLSGNEALGDAGAAAIAAAPWAKSLTRLRLDRCKVGSEGARAISHSPALRGLIELSLNNNSIGETGLKAIASTQWPELCDLRLSYFEHREEALLELMASPLLHDLLELELDHCGVTGRVLEQLCHVNPAYLRKLVIGGSPKIAGAGVDALVKPEALPALRNLGIANCNLPLQQMLTLAGSQLMDRLRAFLFYGNTVSRESQAIFQKVLARTLGGDWLEEDDLDKTHPLGSDAFD
jgi:uncharacterized protein (TIGR02996 family)